MKNKEIKKRFVDNFNNQLDLCDVPDNYNGIVRKLEEKGIALLKAKPKGKQMFSYVYAVLVLFLCIMTGLIGYYIRGDGLNREFFDKKTKDYLAEQTVAYYERPIFTMPYSDYEEIYICMGVVKDGDTHAINYFYSINFFKNFSVIFKNLNNNAELELISGSTLGNLSELLSISNHDEILISIEYGDQVISQTF